VNQPDSLPLPQGDEHLEVVVSQITIVKRGEAIFDETATHVRLQDEAAGEFVEISQQSGLANPRAETIQIEPSQWPKIREVVDYMISKCRS